MKKSTIKVLMRGGGDIASAIARRLYLCGLNTVILELPGPRAVRHAVSYSTALYNGEIEIEGVRAVRSPELPRRRRDFIPVIADPECRLERSWKPDIVIDARMRKKEAEAIPLESGRFVLGIGPDYETGVNCHAIVETNRGHSLGRVIWSGRAAANTREPATVMGYSQQRILRAPISGVFQPVVEIGASIRAGEIAARVDNTTIIAAIDGMVRGILFPGFLVHPGQKVGDIDPRMNYTACFTISDKANAIAGGAMEAVFTYLHQREHQGPAKNIKKIEKIKKTEKTKETETIERENKIIKIKRPTTQEVS